jgi:hypothetical protein
MQKQEKKIKSQDREKMNRKDKMVEVDRNTAGLQ